MGPFGEIQKKAIILCLKGRANLEELELFSDMPKEFPKIVW
jgi:hypothetical protein